MSDVYDYSFSGKIVDNGLSHVFIKFRGKYYDGVKGIFNPSGKIIDNLKDDGRSIGSDQIGWIDYQLGSKSYKLHPLYKQFMDIADEIDESD